MDDKFILIGIIVASHGIKGEVKIKTFLSNINEIKNFKFLYDENQNIFEITNFKDTPKNLIVKFASIIDRNQADELKGKKLFLLKEDLPKKEEEEFYHYELIGLNIIDLAKKNLGKVKAFHNFGAGEIIEIHFDNNTTELFNFNKENFPEINLDEKYIMFNAPKEI